MTIAIWCILIAGTLPYVAFGLVKGLDPHQPRAGVAGLDGRAARAYGAQLNGFETFPIFAAAVIVSHVVGGPSMTANILAVAYVLLRIGHMVAYIADRQPLRSAAFTVAQLVAAAIFILPAFR
ncbi:MAG: MAPEG family protein [Roseiarcus sp.]|uniref:MAPEG family protein n=1 Tax=Roseiarcus sp. TaxID=1969460 RepID=UPI003C4EC959